MKTKNTVDFQEKVFSKTRNINLLKDSSKVLNEKS